MARCCCGSRRTVAARRWADLRSRAAKHQRLRGRRTTRAWAPAAAPARSRCLERGSEERHFTTKRVAAGGDPLCGETSSFRAARTSFHLACLSLNQREVSCGPTWEKCWSNDRG